MEKMFETDEPRIVGFSEELARKAESAEEDDTYDDGYDHEEYLPHRWKSDESGAPIQEDI